MAKTSTRSFTSAAATTTAFLLKAAPGGKKRVVVPRPKTYGDALNAAAKHFPSIPKDDIVLQSDELDILPGELVEISAEFWEEAVVSLNAVYVVRSESHDVLSPDLYIVLSVAIDSSCDSDDQALQSLPSCMKKSPSPGVTLPASLDLVEKSDTKGFKTISANTSWGIIPCKVGRKTRVSTVLNRVAEALNKEASELRYFVDGEYLHHHGLVGDVLWEKDEDYPLTIDIFPVQSGGKPVIYLSSPMELDATVNLSLVPSWKFSAIYPVVPTKTSVLGDETLSWQVRTYADGSLLEKTTGLDVAYLFWEAHTNAQHPPSPPSSPLPGQNASIEQFCPNTSDVYDYNSVVLPVTGLTPYLDKALMTLGLHTEARTSFITYWLPSFLKHTHIALRFVPQAAYECAAPLNISPVPDIITRVFMLFKGVSLENLELWPEAQARVANNVEMWREVIGVDVEKASNPGLFRVLEWGGMEVLRR